MTATQQPALDALQPSDLIDGTLIDGETDSKTGERNSDSDSYESGNEVLFWSKKAKERTAITSGARRKEHGCGPTQTS